MPSGFIQPSFSNISQGRKTVVVRGSNKSGMIGTRMNMPKEVKIDEQYKKNLEREVLVCDGDACTFDEIDDLWDQIEDSKPLTLKQ